MAASVDVLLQLLDVAPDGPNSYCGSASGGGHTRLFGGHVAGQALAAAAHTVTNGVPHSMHSYFLRPGSPDLPIRYEVERVRDGRSFASRRVVALQDGRHLFSLQASFHQAEDGPAHQYLAPTAPQPDDCEVIPTTPGTRESEWPVLYEQWGSLDLRYASPAVIGGANTTTGHPSHTQVWMRTTAAVDRPQAEHSCILACISDLTLLSAAIAPHGNSVSHAGFATASLDHCLWFHRPFRMDEWMLYDQISPTASQGRGMARGEIFQHGHHVATVMQEGSIRRV
ncbi:acyl-CoA thioesterase domain-containing protein [Mycolicibacterium sp.]|uniref:acyl-CoA thioesterase n=1 Tax=Mycolicibacterium sp. TaxID=2320850 RepID=UPI001A25C7C3|nr:acyl-CoA thioesterase domain-containing protein [Mycolicibacterium sp.]MBJ7336375.1 thioesterase family protein [Mycolicibacterium sp.]